MQSRIVKLLSKISYRVNAVNNFSKKGSVIDVLHGPKYPFLKYGQLIYPHQQKSKVF